MPELKKRFLNSNFKLKIILTFCVILTVNMIISSASYYFYANRSTAQTFKKNSQDILRQINLHLDEKFTGLARKVNAISSNLSFVTPMNQFLQDDKVKMDPILAGEIANIIFEIKNSDDFIDSIYIYTSKCVFDDYLMLRKKGVVFEDTPMYRYFVYKPWELAAWFPAMENPMYESRNTVIPVVYRQKIGSENIYFVINISQEALADYLEAADVSFEKIFVVDADGNPILGCDAQLEAAVLKQIGPEQAGGGQEFYDTISVAGSSYHVAAASMGVNQWTVCALTTTAKMMRDLRHIRIFLVLENMVTSICCLTAILWISNLLTGSLIKLAGEMEKAGDENYRVHFDYAYGDEIGRLGKSFNRMVDEIHKHIQALEEEKEQVKEIQKQKRKAEHLALQAQINPHFLYNTLNMITWQAIAQEAEEISVISSALGKYFRISLSRGKESIPLKDELAHVKNYLEIQKIRYKSKLTYNIRTSAEVEQFYTIKLILQPLVENSICHGIKERDGVGNIWIYSEVGDERIQLIVEDDGEGMPQEKIELLNSRMQKGTVDSETGYGIYNVNNRLRLYYGEHYGLHLEPRSAGGVKAVLTIPVRTMEGMDDDV